MHPLQGVGDKGLKGSDQVLQKKSRQRGYRADIYRRAVTSATSRMVQPLKLLRLNDSPWQSPHDRTSTGLAFCSLCPLTGQTY